MGEQGSQLVSASEVRGLFMAWAERAQSRPGEQCLGPSQTVWVLFCTEGIFLKAADVSMAGMLGVGLSSLQEEAIAASLRDEAAS